MNTKETLNYTGKWKTRRIFAWILLCLVMAGSLWGGLFIYGLYTRDVPAIRGEFFLRDGSIHYSDGKRTFTLEMTADSVKTTSTDGKTMWFTAPAARGNTFDLYRMESGKEPVFIVHDVENWLVANARGDRVFVKSKNQRAASELLLYSDKGKTRRKLAENITELFLPGYGNDFWYTKGKQLWYCNMDGDAFLLENDARGHFLACGERKNKAQLVYLRGKNNELCIADAGSNYTNQLAAGIDEETLPSMLTEYKPAGNLYFYKAAQTDKLTWRDVLKDTNVEDDAALVRPNKEDYFNILGFLGYWNPKYDEALEKYDEKLARDKLREGLEELDDELFTLQRELCVWDGREVISLCTVAVEDTLALRQNGAAGAAVSLRKFQTSSRDISDFIKNNAPLLEEAREELLKSVATQELCLIVTTTKGSGVQVLPLAKEYGHKNTSFIFSQDGYRLYGLVRRKVKTSEKSQTFYDVYYQDIEGKNLSPRKEIQQNAQSVSLIGEDLWCVLPDKGGRVFGELWRIPDGRPERRERVAEYVHSFRAQGDGVVIFHHPLDENKPANTRLSFWRGGELFSIDGESPVVVKSVTAVGRKSLLFLSYDVGQKGDTLKLWQGDKVVQLAVNAQLLG
ncbi:MAG: hypothetical protein FWG82_01250 [Oscillospiraceae bacterium]|nr:hypothetical protein [Oscillospiraceae bacterium]